MLSLVLMLITLIAGTPAQKANALNGTASGNLHIGSWASPTVNF